MKALKPLRDTAFDACDMIGDTAHKYHKFLMTRMAKGFQEMHLFMTPMVKVRSVVLPFNNIIEMPKDFVYETKVGIVKDGRIALLKKDYRDNANFIQKYSDDECRAYIQNCLYYDGHDKYTPFYNVNNSGTLYAAGGGMTNDALYTVDKTNGRIYLGSNFPRGTEIIIEYKSDGMTEELQLIPSEMDKAIESYGLLDYYTRKNNFTMIREYEKRYNEQWYMLKELYQFKPIDYYTTILNEIDRGTLNNLI